MSRVTPLALGSLLGFLLIDTALAEHVRATWYGHELGGRKTASGQIFKPHGMTAAHRSFPFGTCSSSVTPRRAKA